MKKTVPLSILVFVAVAVASCGAVAGNAHPVRDELRQFMERTDRDLKGYIAQQALAVPDALRHGQPKCDAAEGIVNASRVDPAQRCGDGSYCYSGESCCEDGQYCCGEGMSCCQESCCTNSTGPTAETCCPDPKNGGVCCLEENTFCCPPNNQTDKPSRCCPRWFVCCATGRYGCCDPGTGLPMEDVLAADESLPAVYVPLPNHPSLKSYDQRRTHEQVASNVQPETPAPPAEVLAMFEEPGGGWSGSMVLRTAYINPSNGSIRKQVPVGPGFDTEQESTRVFMFDPTRRVFMLLQANYTDPAAQQAITLYTIDAATGTTNVTPVTVAEHEVTGYAFVEMSNTILMATTWRLGRPGHARAGYKFYTVDPLTGVATFVSSIQNQKTEDTWAGWFHEVSDDMKYVYRLGWRHVTTPLNFGVQITNLTSAAATQLPFIEVPMPRFYGNLRSMHVVQPDAVDPTKTRFVSLAPLTNDTVEFGDLAVVTWQPSAPDTFDVVCQWSKAKVTETFGPIGEVVDRKQLRYAAAVVQYSPLGTSWNAWSLGIADLKTKGSNVFPLSPMLLSSTDSLSGIGLATF